MKFNNLFTGIFIGSSLLIAQIASAAEITFRVPLQYSNLHPDVDKIKIECSLVQTVSGTDRGAGRDNLSYTKILPPVYNGLNTVVNIRIPITDGTLKSQVPRSAVCFMKLKKRGASSYVDVGGKRSNRSWVNGCENTTPESADAFRCAKQNSVFVNSVNVSIVP